MHFLSDYSALIADVGATNIRLAIYYNQTIQKIKQYKCADFSSIEKAIDKYINNELEEDIPTPSVGAIALACPVIGDKVKMTNHDWEFSIRKLEEHLNMVCLEVVNDFTALACALPFLSLNDIYKIQGIGETLNKHPMCVIGAGTGLGISTLINIGSDYFPLPGEGGHMTLSGLNEKEEKIISYLREKFSLASFETVLSGKGIINIYETLCYLRDEEPDEKITPEEIFEKARNKESSIYLETLEVFSSFLANISGNIALSVGAKGGVFLVGNIISSIREFIDSPVFREIFENKDNMSDYLSNIPVYIVTYPTPAFLGLKYIINKVNE